jgi:hypothetical protein
LKQNNVLFIFRNVVAKGVKMQDEPDDKLGNDEDAESRAHRRIADALKGDDIDALAAALGQVPDPAWHAPDSHGGQQTSHGGCKERGGLWSGRLATMLQPRRQCNPPP